MFYCNENQVLQISIINKIFIKVYYFLNLFKFKKKIKVN